MKTDYYINLDNEVVQVEMLEWLEDGTYFDEDQNDDESILVELPCSRYCIGDEDGDGISVWLNEDMQEVIL
ncbi:MAG: hypothetical protein L3K52_15255 [Candidatus Thiothrix sulfatifontis]|nr:MAG: hypothetical protein L3K52_15255 [Candidatus Thiothrix sulfatifontis]